MLKVNDLKENEALKGLTDDQLKAIETLASIAENKLVADKTRSIWDSVDADIKAVTGIDKGTSIKSYDHLKSVLGDLVKGKADTNVIAGYETKIKTLEDQLKDGKGGEAFKTKIAELEGQITKRDERIGTLQTQFKGLEDKYEGELKTRDANMMDLKWGNEIGKYRNELTFKKGIPDAAVDAMIKIAAEKTKTLGTAVFGDGVIHYKDEDGLLMYDKKNGHKPVEAKSFFMSQLEPILDSNSGAGSGKAGAEGKTRTYMNIGAAKTRQEGLGMIIEQVKSEGLISGTKAFTDRQIELATESKAELDAIQ